MRQRLLKTFAAAMVLLLAMPAVAAPADDPSEPSLTFVGGGWGHGVGMSQHGALGRALAGHSSTDILDFYYEGTSLAGAGSVAGGVDVNDVDVLLAVRDAVTLTPPEGSGWQIQLTHDGVVIDGAFATHSAPVFAWFDGNENKWHADVGPDDARIDLCADACVGGTLGAVIAGGQRLVVEGVGEYAYGTIELIPAAHCGEAGGTDICVINGAMTFDQYLYGVAEVPGSWPDAALTAQAVAARSFALSRMGQRIGWVFDMYSDTSDQNYVGWSPEKGCPSSWCTAIDASSDQVLTYGGAVISAVYSSSNGGHTAGNADVWASSPLPYLLAKPDPFDAVDSNPNASWERSYSVSDVSRWLAAGIPGAGDLGMVQRIEFIDLPASGFTDQATVEIHSTGSETPLETTGYQLWQALRSGCSGDAGCDPIVGRHYVIASFFDVPANAFFAAPVAWMTSHEITTGIDLNTFGPGLPNTRAGLATFLHRFAGEPDPGVGSPFMDVPPGAFYEQAVAWASARGVTSGVQPEFFIPDGIVSRDQAAAMLWRFAGSPASTGANPFTDVPADAYYAEAVRWMVEWGITQGTTETTYSPREILTRGQIATLLWRLAGQPDAFAPEETLPIAMRTE